MSPMRIAMRYLLRLGERRALPGALER